MIFPGRVGLRAVPKAINSSWTGSFINYTYSGSPGMTVERNGYVSILFNPSGFNPSSWTNVAYSDYHDSGNGSTAMQWLAAAPDAQKGAGWSIRVNMPAGLAATAGYVSNTWRDLQDVDISFYAVPASEDVIIYYTIEFSKDGGLNTLQWLYCRITRLYAG